MEQIENITPLLDGHEYRPVKTCPKCTSLFITDNECEGCGFQFSYSPLGEAFGEKSFYSLKETYWDDRSRLIQLWPSFERRKSSDAQKYLRDLNHRYELLLDFLLGDSGVDRKFYWIEFKDLCRELISYEVSIDELSGKLNDHSIHGYGPLIHDFLNELDVEYLFEMTPWDSLQNYKIGGVLKFRFLIVSGIVLAVLSTASLLVYQYFFLFS